MDKFIQVEKLELFAQALAFSPEAFEMTTLDASLDSRHCKLAAASPRTFSRRVLEFGSRKVTFPVHNQ